MTAKSETNAYTLIVQTANCASVYKIMYIMYCALLHSIWKKSTFMCKIILVKKCKTAKSRI